MKAALFSMMSYKFRHIYKQMDEQCAINNIAFYETEHTMDSTVANKPQIPTRTTGQLTAIDTNRKKIFNQRRATIPCTSVTSGKSSRTYSTAFLLLVAKK